MLVDLHIHTQASDGELSIFEIIELAHKRGIKVIGITDHETFEAVDMAKKLINQFKVKVIGGVEISTELAGDEIHILGYFKGNDYLKLDRFLTGIRVGRIKRAEKIIKKLNDMGLRISRDEMKKAVTGNSIGRPHIARALIEKGKCRTVNEAFEFFIGKGAPAFVPRLKVAPGEAIRKIKEAGGVVVLAHPGCIGNEENIYKVIKYGIAGIEVYSPKNSFLKVGFYKKLAKKFGLLALCGSDFHTREDLKYFGRCDLSREEYNKFESMLNGDCK